MSLRVGPFTRDPVTGKMQFIKVDPGKDLAGFEVYRHEFWGTTIMQELGLKLLPTLGDGIWLVIENEELDSLEEEALIILRNAALIAQKAAPDQTHVEFYANNILNAIRIAREVNGGVQIS